MFKRTQPKVDFMGYEFPINDNFRDVLECIKQNDFISLLPNGEYLVSQLSRINGNISRDILNQLIMLNLFEFESEDKALPPEPNKKPSMDIEQDQKYIFASFIHYYNINLYTIDYLPYNEFNAMLLALKGTKMNDVIDIRTMELPKGKDASKQRAEILKMRRYYSLDLEEEN